MPPPPACVTRYKNSRLVVAQQLQEHPAATSQGVKHKSKCSSRSSIKLSKLSKTLLPQQEKELSLVEAAYVQLCRIYDVKPNSGILNYLQALDASEGCALSSLDTNDNFLGKNGFKVVMGLVACSQRLSTLKVAQQEVNTKTLAELLPILSQHVGLVSIDLSSNPLSIAAARMLAEFSRKTNSVEEMKLDNTHISKEWRGRIEFRMQDIKSKRVCGYIATPIYRSIRSHRTLNLLVMHTGRGPLSEELFLLQTEILPGVNSVLQPRGVTVLPWHLQYSDDSQDVLACLSAVRASSDSLNCCLPWVLFLCSEADATRVVEHAPFEDPSADSRFWSDIWNESYQPQTQLATLAQYVGLLLDDVEPPPPLTDKNGKRRAPVREQVPSIHVFCKTAIPPQVQKLTRHRLCVSHCYDTILLPSAFSATVVSLLLRNLDKVYPGTSHVDNYEAVAECAQEYMPSNLHTSLLYSEKHREVSPVLHNQWFIADDMLKCYEHRSSAEQELMGYCVRYEPEGDCTYPLVMYGQMGAGKSTLLAWLAEELSREESGVAVIPLFISAGKDTSSLNSILRQLIVAVRDACGLPQVPSLEAHSLIHEWHTLLVQEDTTARVVVLVGGLDLVDNDEGTQLLPTTLATNMRLVASVASQSKHLTTLRERVPHPYELLITGLSRHECLRIVHSHIALEIPGLATVGDEGYDEGVIKQPSNAADAVCFKDHGTYPLYLVLLANVLKRNHYMLRTPTETLAFVTSLPETTYQLFGFMLETWERALGEELVGKMMTLLILSKEGFYPSVIQGVLSDPSMTWDTDYDIGKGATLWALVAPLTRENLNGMRSLVHPELAKVVWKKYPFGSELLEKIHSSIACFHFRSMVSQLSSPYMQNAALLALPSELLAAGRVIDAFTLVTDLSFVERKLQAGFFWELLSDTEQVEAMYRRCMEAFVDGFETYQFRPVPEIGTLRAVRSVCIEKESILRAYPSVYQVCLGLPPSNDCHKLVSKLLEIEGIPHPLLKWKNKKCRPSLASSVLQIGDSVVHVSFAQEIREDGLLLATTHSAVYVCKVSAVVKKLAITDTLSAPSDGYLASTFTPDGNLIVTAAATQLVVWRWEAEAPVLHNLMDVAPSITRCMSFDGITCVALQVDTGKGAIIETRKGRVISTLRPHADGEPVRNIFYASAAHVVVSVGIGTVCVYNGPDQVTYMRVKGIITCCDISPDGKLVVCSDGQDIHLWSAVTGNLIGMLNKHAVLVKDVSFHPNGHLLASCDVDGFTWVWSSLGSAVIQDPLSTGIGAAMWAGFTPGGGKLVTRCTQGVHVYDTTTFTSHGVIGGHHGRVTFAASSPDMSTLATCSEDGTVQLFSLDDTYSDPVAWLDLSTVLYPTQDLGERSDAHCHGVQEAKVSRDGRVLATVFCDGTLKTWDAAGKLVHCIEGEGIASCAFVPDSQILVLGMLSAIKLLDYKTGEVVVHMPAARGLMAEEHGEGFRLAELSPDCVSVTFVVYSSVDKHLSAGCHTFSIPDRKKVASYGLHTNTITGLKYFSEGYLVTVSRDADLRMWSTATQSELVVLPLGSPAECLDLVDSHAVVGLQSGVAVVVALSQGSAVLAAEVNCGYCLTAIHLCGEYLFTAAEDSTCKVWSRSTGQCLTSVATLDVPTAVATYHKTGVQCVTVGGSSGFVYQYDILK